MITLQVGSFKGVPFLFRQASKTDGRLTVDYLYPYQTQQQVVDMGAQITTYTLEISTTGVGEQYFINRKRLIDAFRSQGAGTLVHPIDGTVKAQLTTYTVNENIQQLGVAEFTATFKVTSEPQYPTASDSGQSDIEFFFNENLAIARAAFIANWDSDLEFQSEFVFYDSYVSNLAINFNVALTRTIVDKGKITPFTTSVNKIDNGAKATRIKNIRNAGIFADNILNTYNAMQDLSSDTSQKSLLNRQFFGYSSGNELEVITPSSQKIVKNKKSLDIFINTISLLYEHLNTSNITYQIQDDIEAQSKVLNNQYYYIKNNNFYETIFNTTDQTKVNKTTVYATQIILNKQAVLENDNFESITESRDYVANYLSQQLTNAKRVVTIRVQNQSMVSLVYQLYGELSLYDTLVRLNQLGNPAYITGEIKILES